MIYARLLWLLGLCWLTAVPSFACAGEEALMRLSAPPVAQAAALLRASVSGALHDAGARGKFVPWRSPEQLRSFVANGEVDAIIASLPTASVFAAKSVPCAILAVYSAPLWIVALEDGEAVPESPREAFASLRGAEVLLPFGPGDMPELALDVLSRASGVPVRKRHCGGAMEAANLLRSGRASHALLAEPAASLVAEQKKGGKKIRKVVALKAVWPEVFPGRTAMPTAALVAVGPLAKNEAACAVLRRAFLEGALWVEKFPADAVLLAEKHFPELGGMLAVSPHEGTAFISRDILAGPEGEKEARFMLERLFERDPASLGGTLPGEDIWRMGNDVP